MDWELHAILGALTFLMGTVVGSFLNVCIYRIPWQKSVIWPESRCPSCLAAIAPRDNVPIFGWLALGGACRSCRRPISVRYPLVELLVGLLFLGVYLVDVAIVPHALIGPAAAGLALRAAYHMSLIALLVAATFIDYDLYIIPDEVTVPGMVIGLAVGALAPGVRPAPSTAATPWEGLLAGLLGWAVGGGLIWSVRILGGLIFRREAMGFGDVTLMAMIGAFLGWQATLLTLFLGACYGLGHAAWKLVAMAGKWLGGRKISGSDREIPFGPYLSMAAATLVLSWPWLWDGWAKEGFRVYSVVFWYVLGLDR